MGVPAWDTPQKKWVSWLCECVTLPNQYSIHIKQNCSDLPSSSFPHGHKGYCCYLSTYLPPYRMVRARQICPGKKRDTVDGGGRVWLRRNNPDVPVHDSSRRGSFPTVSGQGSKNFKRSRWNNYNIWEQIRTSCCMHCWIISFRLNARVKFRIRVHEKKPLCKQLNTSHGILGWMLFFCFFSFFSRRRDGPITTSHLFNSSRGHTTYLRKRNSKGAIYLLCAQTGGRD